MSKESKWLDEYEQFLNSDHTQVPATESESVFRVMKELISPSPWNVFAKVLGIHVVVGSLSLAVCHQFDMNPFGTPLSLADWFMAMWGHNVCMIACGVLFFGLSILVAGYLLSVEEVRALRRTEFLQNIGLAVLSLAAFAISGAELAVTFAALWFLGGLLGGLMATEAVFRLRRS